MKVALVVAVGANRGRSLTLRDTTFTIGRDSGCQLRADSESISRRHCEILVTEAGVLLRDLGSMNGTLVNGGAVRGEIVPLEDGDRLEIGPLKFVVKITEEAGQPTAEMSADVTATETPPVAEPDPREEPAESPTVEAKPKQPAGPTAEGISKAADDLIKKMLAKSAARRPKKP
jgi:pSer/pThr/pTyr-binding forkhead associated (FHA) protein